MILFPYLNAIDLVIFLQVSKACYALLDVRSKHCVNFQILFREWGIELTTQEVEETFISTSRTLQKAKNWVIPISITKSKHIIPENSGLLITGTVMIPNIKQITVKSEEEIKNLRINHVSWGFFSVGFNLNDGQKCLAGTLFSNSHTFDPAKKITKVECIINRNEKNIIRINFYSYNQRICKVELESSNVRNNIKKNGGRREIFLIADDEQLIGCELDHTKFYFRGVTWIKIKMQKMGA